MRSSPVFPMPLSTLYIFADEAGNLTFPRKGQSILQDVTIAHHALDLRHELAIAGHEGRGVLCYRGLASSS